MKFKTGDVKSLYITHLRRTLKLSGSTYETDDPAEIAALRDAGFEEAKASKQEPEKEK
jgi:hypothetical protein